MADRPPDLRVMLVGVARALNSLYPNIVTGVEIQRIEEADNVLLVLSRILTAMAKRAGVPQDQVLQIVAEAKRPPPLDPADLFEVKPVTDARVTGNHTDWEIIQGVDTAMISLESRAKMPVWFIDEFWPPVLQRCASGRPMSDRERSVSMYVSSVARGEW